MGQEEVRGVLLGVRSSRGFVCLLGYSYIYLCECYLNVSSLNQKYRINRIGLLVIALIMLFACALAGLCFWSGYSAVGTVLASLDVLGVIVVVAGIIKSFQQPSINSSEGQK